MKGKIIGDFVIEQEPEETLLGKFYFARHKFMHSPHKVLVLDRKIGADSSAFEKFERSVSLYARLSDPSLAKLHTISSFQDDLYLVYAGDLSQEEMPLEQFLSSRRERLSEETIYEIARQIAAALDLLHENGLYGGLNLRSVYITENIHVRLYNVGIGKTAGSLAEMLAGGAASRTLSKLLANQLYFMAPEEKTGKDVNYKIDHFAFGTLVYFLLMGQFPEGYFPLPSSQFENSRFNWDLLIKSLLSPMPARRRENLSSLISEMKEKELGQIFKKIESRPYFAEEVSIPKPKPAPSKSRVSQYVTVKETAVLELEKESVPQEKEPVIMPSKLERHEYESDPGAIFQKEITIKPYKPAEKEMSNIEPVLAEMVIIEAGEYMRGSNTGARDERPRHKIYLDAFALDVQPVTNEQYIRFLEAMGGEKDVTNNDMIQLKESRIKRTGGRLAIESGYARHPVVGVSWYGAAAYAKWVGKRLPTEAEWEIAATQGIEENITPFGPEIERMEANFFGTDTTAVMSYPSTDIGLYDMAGNVYEWCEDWYDYNYYDTSTQEPKNPKGPVQGIYRVLRGGCWKSLKEDLRASHRHRNNPGTMNRTYGFRLAADVK